MFIQCLVNIALANLARVWSLSSTEKVLVCTWLLVIHNVYFWTISVIDVVYHWWYPEFFFIFLLFYIF